MSKEVREARSKDKAELTKAIANNDLRGVQQENSNLYRVCCKWVPILRERYFDGRSLRRTLDSKDHKGATIWEMPAPVEQVFKLRLYAHEYDVLELAAEDAKNARKSDATWRQVSFTRYVISRCCAQC